MTFEEFLEKCRETDGWEVVRFHRIKNSEGMCPLQAVFGRDKWDTGARDAGLNVSAIWKAADGYTKGPYRKALLGLVKP